MSLAERPAARLPIQYVVRSTDYRGYAGQLASGVIEIDDVVVIMPSGMRTTIVGIDTFDGEVPLAHAPQSVVVRLADDIDVGRGDLIVHPRQEPRVVREFDATVCQLSDRRLNAGDRVLIKHTTKVVKAVVASVNHRLDVVTLEHDAADSLGLNEIGGVTLRVAGIIRRATAARIEASVIASRACWRKECATCPRWWCGASAWSPNAPTRPASR